MEEEARLLRQDLCSARESLKSATRKCHRLVRELDEKAASHDAERRLRDQQLSRILRALLILESKLKQEQKSIRQLLCEKDSVIRIQQLEIAKLRRFTKSYIKAKRGQDFESFESSVQDDASVQTNLHDANDDIQKLKREIITRLQDDRRVQKTSSFSGSDISKTSSETTEATTTSFVSTEGFCEGESPAFLTDSECDIKPKFEESEKTKKENSEDDGMDCNYNSEPEEKEHIFGKASNVLEESTVNWYSDPETNDESFTIYQSNSNRNSVLECVNQILLRDMEDEENSLSLSRRYKHKGKVVCFQAAKLSDIESVGSEVERKNSEETPENSDIQKPEVLETFPGFEDEFGERKIQEAKALVIIEPDVKLIPGKSNVDKIIPVSKSTIGREKLPSKRLSVAKNLDYEDIESVSEASYSEKSPTKFHKTLILKEIPSPSFLINESKKKLPQKRQISVIPKEKSPKPENTKRKIDFEADLIGNFEEFKIEDEDKDRKEKQSLEIDFDMTQNFEEFKFDEFSDDPDRVEADGSDLAESRNTLYDNFLEASGMSNKSILTPSRLLSNHKSVMKPKDVKYKSRIKSGAEKHSVAFLQTKHWTGPFV